MLSFQNAIDIPIGYARKFKQEYCNIGEIQLFFYIDNNILKNFDRFNSSHRMHFFEIFSKMHSNLFEE